jgi:hypothetical protein
MSLPTAFSNLTNPTGPELDGNFAAVGVLTVIPCTVAGTNSLTLAPLTNTPTVVSYANYGRFSGVAAATNTGATQARVGALPLLNVYRDTPAGPAALVGNEIIINCAFTLIYDGTLNSNAGGFHLVSNANSFPYTGGTISNGTISIVNSTLSTLTMTGGALTGNTLTGNSIVIGGSISGTVGTLAKLMVGTSASSITRIISALSTISYTVVPAQTSQSQQIAVAGAQVNDDVSLGPPATVTTGLGFMGFVPAAGTVSVRCLNITAASIAAFSVVMRTTVRGFT